VTVTVDSLDDGDFISSAQVRPTHNSLARALATGR